MRKTHLAFVLVLMFGWSPAVCLGAEYPHSIHFFIIGEHPSLQHPHIETWVHNVQDLGATDRFLSRHLASQNSIARRQADSRIERNLNAIRTALKTEVEIRLLLERFGINRFPAAVVNENVTFYGIIDIDEVISAWRASR